MGGCRCGGGELSPGADVGGCRSGGRTVGVRFGRSPPLLLKQAEASQGTEACTRYVPGLPSLQRMVGAHQSSRSTHCAPNVVSPYSTPLIPRPNMIRQTAYGPGLPHCVGVPLHRALCGARCNVACCNVVRRKPQVASCILQVARRVLHGCCAAPTAMPCTVRCTSVQVACGASGRRTSG